MLVAAGVTPHSPLLLPSIGKQQQTNIKSTLTAMDQFGATIKEAAPDIMVVISSHGDIIPRAFTIPLAQSYKVQFEQFGDYATTLTIKSAMGFIQHFKRKMESADIPVILQSADHIDYSIGVPLQLWQQTYKKYTLMPINVSLLDARAHVDFGRAVAESISESDQRIAVIASAELSHALSPRGPGKFSPQAKEFDKKVIQLLKQQKIEGLIGLDATQIEQAEECGLRSLLIFSGILEKINYDFQVLNYDDPFGVGMLVAECKLG